VPDNVFAAAPSEVLTPESQEPLDELSAVVEPAPQAPAPGAPRLPADIRTSGKAIAALILGILAFFSLGITGIPALILGVVALHEIDRSSGLINGKGMAIWGIALGGIWVTFLTVLGWCMLVVIFEDAWRSQILYGYPLG